MPTAESHPDSDRLLLAADVGGTKTLLQLRRHNSEGAGEPLAEQRYQSAAFSSLEQLVERFLDDSALGRPQSACFAVAGPVNSDGEGQTARLTNLPWRLDSRQMAQRLNIPRIALLNDFQAIGYSLDALPPEDLVTLQAARAVSGAPRLVVGAGTGLGVTVLYPDGEDYRSYPSEGGHIAFAPADAQQQRLLAYMQQQHERVSCERLISGSGLVAIYRFLLPPGEHADDPLLRQEDPAAAIGEHGLAAAHSTAGEALALFCRLYGAFAGDLALASLPRGGLFIAGGIAPKLLPRLLDGGFMAAFLDKGRMHGLLRDIPLQVITNPRCGLLGAAHYAARL
jgi:glucokinase